MNLGNVLVADDHSFVLSFIREILEKNFHANNITCLTNLSDLIKEIEKKEHDLYILDLDFKEDDSYDLIKRIKEQYKKAKIIVNTAHWESWHINALLKLDLSGIVLKDACEKYLIEAIPAAMNGIFYLCPNCRIRKYNYLKNFRKTKNLEQEITPKEVEILEDIANGFKTPAIAERRNISINTVEFHRKNLMLKLEAENAPHLIAKAVYYQLVNLKRK